MVGLLAIVPSLQLEPVEQLRREVQQADMRRLFESIPLPDDARLVGISEAPYPATTYYYGIAGTEREVCDLVYAASRDLGEPTPWPKNPCGLTMRVSAGWPARAFGTSSYELRAFVRFEAAPTLNLPADFCKREISRNPPLEERMAPCWLNPGEIYVLVTLFGDQVWVQADVPEDAA